MTIILRYHELLHLLRDGTQNAYPDLLANPKDQTLIVPHCLGAGYKRYIAFGRGDISIALHHYQIHEDMVIFGPESQRNSVELSFVAQAKFIAGGQSFNINQDVFFQNSCSPAHEARHCGGQEIMGVDIHIKKSVLATMLETYEATLPSELYRMVIGDSDRHAWDAIKIRPAMQHMLRQIWHCPYEGLTRSLFLEARSLELIGLYFQAAEDGDHTMSSLRSVDVESIRHAQEILQQNLHAPPSLMELARRVGINDRKLKQGFRDLCDTTVFGYLTQQRMERACQLLLRDVPVSTVASMVGYKSHAAFSGAFRRTLGVTPKAYQMSHRREA